MRHCGAWFVPFSAFFLGSGSLSNHECTGMFFPSGNAGCVLFEWSDVWIWTLLVRWLGDA